MRFFRGTSGAFYKTSNLPQAWQVSKALLSEGGVIIARLDQQVELQRVCDKDAASFSEPRSYLTRWSDARHLSAFLFTSGRNTLVFIVLCKIVRKFRNGD